MLNNFFILFFLCSFVWAQEEDSLYVDESPNSQTTQVSKSYVDKFLGPQFKQKVKELMADNPFAKMARPTLKSFILQSFEGRPVGKVLEKYPEVLDFTLDVLQDDEALPKLFSLVEKEDKLKTYAVISLCLFIGFLVAGLFNNKGGVFRRILIKLLLTVGFLLANIMTVCVYFEEELSPIYRILKGYI